MVVPNGLNNESFADFASQRLVKPEENISDIVPHGSFLYAMGTRLLTIGAYSRYASPSVIRTFDEVTPKGFVIDSIDGGRNRIVVLDHLDVIQVAQIAANEVDISYPAQTLEARPHLQFKIDYVGSKTDGERARPLTRDERDFLTIFTAEQGGFAFFSRADLPEAAAMLLETTDQGKRKGLVFSFQSDDPSVSYDSLSGLSIFLQSVEDQLRDPRNSTPEQEEALKILKYNLDRGTVSLNNIIRGQLLTLRAISQARVHGGPSSQPFFADVFEPPRGRLASLVTSVIDKTPQVNRAIDDLLIGTPGHRFTIATEQRQAKERIAAQRAAEEQRVAELRAAEETRMSEFIAGLKTEIARSLRSDIRPYWEGPYEQNLSYLMTLEELSISSTNIELLDDVGVLLDEWSKTGVAAVVAIDTSRMKASYRIYRIVSGRYIAGAISGMIIKRKSDLRQ